MFIIWRRWGWLVLAFFLLVWWLAENVVAGIYSQVSGLEGLYNAEKGITWGVAFFVVAALMFAFNLWALRSERVQLTEEEWEARKQKSIRAWNASHLKDETHEQRKAFTDQMRAQPVPPLDKASSFFFIPMRFMPFIFVAIGIFLLVLNIPTALAEAPGR